MPRCGQYSANAMVCRYMGYNGASSINTIVLHRPSVLMERQSQADRGELIDMRPKGWSGIAARIVKEDTYQLRTVLSGKKQLDVVGNAWPYRRF